MTERDAGTIGRMATDADDGAKTDDREPVLSNIRELMRNDGIHISIMIPKHLGIDVHVPGARLGKTLDFLLEAIATTMHYVTHGEPPFDGIAEGGKPPGYA